MNKKTATETKMQPLNLPKGTFEETMFYSSADKDDYLSKGVTIPMKELFAIIISKYPKGITLYKESLKSLFDGSLGWDGTFELSKGINIVYVHEIRSELSNFLVESIRHLCYVDPKLNETHPDGMNIQDFIMKNIKHLFQKIIKDVSLS